VSYWQCANVSEPTARKEHTCSQCGDTIQPGQTYKKIRGLWEGEWTTHKWCMRCECLSGNQCITPEEGARIANEAARDPDRWPMAWWEDCRVLVMEGAKTLSPRDRGLVLREAIMLPNTGLLGWEEVHP
jgi:hypothetical protein